LLNTHLLAARRKTAPVSHTNSHAMLF